MLTSKWKSIPLFSAVSMIREAIISSILRTELFIILRYFTRYAARRYQHLSFARISLLLKYSTHKEKSCFIDNLSFNGTPKLLLKNSFVYFTVNKPKLIHLYSSTGTDEHVPKPFCDSYELCPH